MSAQIMIEEKKGENPFKDINKCYANALAKITGKKIKMPKNLQDNLFKHYIQKSKFRAKDQSYLKNDFDILSVQRNLKILGIFYRLFKRDNKPQYLKYLPYTWSLIELRMKNKIFKNLKIILKKAVNKKIRKKRNFK